ncbi:MAG: hypothetical protein HQL87_13730 [Magnetococcales bacterium]|nr:hypothetical protein [Magnetococcales bacterium]
MGSRWLAPLPWLSKRTALGLAVLLALPTAASAFSLGEIRVHSPFGTPFQAEIPLVLHPDETAKGVETTVADGEAYQLLNLPRDAMVTQLHVTLEGKGTNRRIILHSDTPLRTPFFNLLLKTAVGVGSHYRNYPVFLDISRTDNSPPQTTASRQTYGPIRNGENLASIARKLRTADVSVSRMMVALWSVNKNHPGFNNMNALATGMTLNLPTPEEISRLSAAEVIQVLAEQRQSLPKTAPPQKKGAIARQANPEQTPTTAPTTTEKVLPPSSEQPDQGAPPPAAPVPAPPNLVEENQRLTASVNKAWEQVGLLSNKVAEVEQRALQNATAVAALQTQLTETQARLQVAEQKWATRPVVAPSPPPAAPAPPHPVPAAEPVPTELLWAGYAGAGLLGFVAAIVLAWSRRKKAVPVPDQSTQTTAPSTPPDPGDPANGAETMPDPPHNEPVLSMAEPVIPDKRDTLATPAWLTPVPDKRDTPATPAWLAPEAQNVASLLAPMDQDGAQPVVLADEIGTELAGSEDEESIFKDLFASPAPRAGAEQTARPVTRADEQRTSSVSKPGEEPLAMIEFNRVAPKAMVPQTVAAPAPQMVQPSTDRMGDRVLEWVVDKK